MTALTLLYGAIIGLSLGLTGGGGAIFAVPLLVFGLDVPSREAVTISLVAVGVTAFAGFLQRWKLGEVELHTGLLFAIAGMAGAPLGSWLASFISDAWLLLGFASLMVVVALRLWYQAAQPQRVTHPALSDGKGATCVRDETGALKLSTRCAVLLVAVGVMSGVLTGLFGVGGGFIIVPALVLFSGMGMHRAVGTSLMVVVMVSLAAIVSQLGAGRTFSRDIAMLFVLGGLTGLVAGQRLVRYLSGPMLQRIFAGAMLVVAGFMVIQQMRK